MVKNEMMNQNLNRKSIFELERRVDLSADYDGILSYMQKSTLVYHKRLNNYYSMLDMAMEFWPYRGTAYNITQYLSRIDITNPFDTQYLSNKDMVCVLELFLNLGQWTKENYRGEDFTRDSYEKYLHYNEKTEETIVRALEMINMQAKHVDSRIIICKRDPDVDSVIEVVPEIADVLLGYLDFRNDRDLDYKQIALKRIADYLEPKEGEYRGTQYHALYKSVSFAMNSFSIRHNTEKQIFFSSDNERMDIYDKLFKSALHLIRAKQVMEYKEEIDGYKPH